MWKPVILLLPLAGPDHFHLFESHLVLQLEDTSSDQKDPTYWEDMRSKRITGKKKKKKKL